MIFTTAHQNLKGFLSTLLSFLLVLNFGGAASEAPSLLLLEIINQGDGLNCRFHFVKKTESKEQHDGRDCPSFSDLYLQENSHR